VNPDANPIHSTCAQSVVSATQQLLDAIRRTPRVNFAPFPAYGENYLPFAMSASIEVTPGGRLWTCWIGGEDGPGAYLLASCSDDGGDTWRDPLLAIDPHDPALPCDINTHVGCFWCDPLGRLWLFFQQSLGMFDGSSSNWSIRCDDPDSEAPSWSAPRYIGFGASLNKPVVRANGEWILPVSLWERWHISEPFGDCYRELDAVRGANAFASLDEGDHWRHRGGIIFEDSCFNEHSIVELRDGRLWMLSRCHTEIAQSFSADGGVTWQPQQTAFPHVSSKCAVRRLRSGNILLVKHGTAMGAATPKRCDLTAFLSTDDGDTWSGGLLLDERMAVSYPDIAQSPDGDIYVHYDRNRAVDAEILFARFREEDVLAQTLSTARASLKNTIKNSKGMGRGAG